MPADEPRSARELFAAGLEIDDRQDPDRLALINEIRRQDDAEAFLVLAEQAGAHDASAQELAVEVLGQFGYERGRPWLERSLPIVTSATEVAELAVLTAEITALGSLADPTSLTVILRHTQHAEPEVRFAVACALPCVGGDPLERAAVAALIELMADPEVGNLEVEAAEELGDPRLLPALQRLRESGWAERDKRGSILETAIEACAN